MGLKPHPTALINGGNKASNLLAHVTAVLMSQEPVHIHVQANNKLAKFWLQPVNLASSIGFNAKELNQLIGLVREHEALYLKASNDFFNIIR